MLKIESVGYIDITEKGGHVLSFLTERPFGKESLPFEDIKKKAETFLKDAGYKDLVYEEARENNTAWHMVYVRVEPEYGAKVFSDIIHLKIAKDNAGIVGLDASEYIRKEKTATTADNEKRLENIFPFGRHNCQRRVCIC